ncbi:MAG TPA: type II toxin-antitoxin system RelE/ParE family toxin [Chitinophagales bacterium]|nr:type II toxin-antitoxin system RelE/ParE family toxin [Chitinophagales bacterium]
MRIIFKESFVNRLDNQIDFIAIDSPARARKFKNDLLDKIREIPENPYRYRKSIYFDSNEVRDFIYKGYTIVFRISQNTIEIFGFVKYQDSI